MSDLVALGAYVVLLIATVIVFIAQISMARSTKAIYQEMIDEAEAEKAHWERLNTEEDL
jgi:hypothetical protein